jgi:hypothetical protein
MLDLVLMSVRRIIFCWTDGCVSWTWATSDREVDTQVCPLTTVQYDLFKHDNYHILSGRGSLLLLQSSIPKLYCLIFSSIKVMRFPETWSKCTHQSPMPSHSTLADGSPTLKPKSTARSYVQSERVSLWKWANGKDVPYRPFSRSAAPIVIDWLPSTHGGPTFGIRASRKPPPATY